ncbi:hypothetical protein F4813DRAFT_370058 [Daldinia decipiens]|uniref:uncharacterized protein n=1 Tax=Daldinia decipiens TaxID=326647 RepID=UPI0020C4DB36|nr:uncharacterized protein F4813DRAFT_370058 [Daldinia decipiens]KAI1654724.1 hypothetical protein F4813DRAFT_370058 [Daldinia decipiens]
MSSDRTPDSESFYYPPPDTGLHKTDGRIECHECHETDYFEHDGDPKNALCKHCGHNKCTDCVDQ